MFLYIQSNNDWNHENKFKYGITQDPYDRLNTDQHSYKTLYHSIYEYTITDKYKLKFRQVDKIISNIGRNNDYIEKLKNHYKHEFIYLHQINKHLVNNNGGTEFIYKDGLEILEQILLIEFNILGIEIKKINIDELQKINVSITSQTNNDFNSDFIINDNEYKLRDYQIEIINKSVEQLIQNKKLYLELATGAGKTVIAYSMFNILNPKTIIILTPRINICEQNISEKYKKILTNKNYNNNINKISSNKYNILCYCIQSFKKVHAIIKNNKLTDILIWFDEAHWGIDGWAENSNFLLIDNEHIKYRLFTSASPDKHFIDRNRHVYGELYTPIKVSELMKEKWLCGIQVHIYEDIVEDVNNISLINFIIQKFHELNKTLGMNFNKDCNTATERFMVHYKLYKENKTDIKPFLLLNDEYINKLSISIDKDLLLTDINIFNVSTNAIGYVVAKYSMGYDNKNIDLLIFSDPKLSSKDIIQSIGRGTRPDQKGTEGKNQSKINDIILPVAINVLDDAYTYDKIKEVIKYLLIDLELDPYDRFTFINKNKTNKSTITACVKEDNDEKIVDIKSIVYNIYTNNFNWTIVQITRHLLNNDIHNYKDYLKYRNDNQYLNLPEELFRTFPKFDFYNTYKLCPYYNKEECIKAIEKYQRELIYNKSLYNSSDKIKYLNKKDNKIPNECLWYFYGGNSKDYLIF
jgi:superfamily II DNA or RNA helicase